MDNFYIPRSELKPGTDIESIDALDLPFFNSVRNQLIHGEEVTLPVFDFKEGKRKTGKKIQLDEDQPIIIEGIHALILSLPHPFPSIRNSESILHLSHR